jgi:hypothetical protein
MPKSIIFHIGDRKTGTTSIQRALKMKAHDLPDTELELIQAYRISQTLWNAGDAAHYNDKWKNVSGRIARSRARTVIISDENFELASAASLRNAIEQFVPDTEYDSLQVMAYVRPHADRVLSSYVQRFKHGTVQVAPADFHAKTLAEGEFLYAPRFQQWHEVFGPRFKLKAMIREHLFRNDVVADFLKEITGKDAFTLNDSLRDSNVSPSVEEMMEMEVFHDAYRKKVAERPDLRSIRLPITRTLLKNVSGAGTPFRLARPLVEQIVRDYEEDARETDLQFFGGAPLLSKTLAAAHGKSMDHPISITPQDHLTEKRIEEIREWTANAIGKIGIIATNIGGRRMSEHLLEASLAQQAGAPLQPIPQEFRDNIGKACEKKMRHAEPIQRIKAHNHIDRKRSSPLVRLETGTEPHGQEPQMRILFHAPGLAAFRPEMQMPRLLGVQATATDTLGGLQATHKLTGNRGNIIHAEAPVKILRKDHTHSAYGNLAALNKALAPRFREKMAANFDIIVISLANFIRPDHDGTALFKAINDLDGAVKIVVLGAGLQGDHPMSAMMPGNRDLISILNERAALLGVRGNRTAEWLASNGFANAAVLGCPSLYTFPQSILSIDGSAARAKGAAADVMTAGHLSVHNKRIVSRGVNLARTFRGIDASYVFQDEIFAYGALPGQAFLYNEGSNECAAGPLNRWLSQISRVPINFRRYYYFTEAGTWRQAALRHDVFIGDRFHGGVAVLQAGRPAIFLKEDNRVTELTEHFALPSLSIDHFARWGLAKTLDECLNDDVLNRMKHLYRQRHTEFSAALAAHGLVVETRLPPPGQITQQADMDVEKGIAPPQSLLLDRLDRQARRVVRATRRLVKR